MMKCFHIGISICSEIIAPRIDFVVKGQIFNSSDNSALAKVVTDALISCDNDDNNGNKNSNLSTSS